MVGCSVTVFHWHAAPLHRQVPRPPRLRAARFGARPRRNGPRRGRHPDLSAGAMTTSIRLLGQRPGPVAGRARAATLVGAAVGVALASLLFVGSASAASPVAAPTPTTPIQHVVVLMQENHTFDNYFGTYPGADGIPAGTCMPIGAAARPCFRPFHLGDNTIAQRDLDHSSATYRLQYNNGQLNGFIRALARRNQDGRLAMGYRDGRDVPFYWNLADQYVLYDRFFSSAGAGSFLNHVYWATGSAGSGYDRVPPNGFSNLPT